MTLKFLFLALMFFTASALAFINSPFPELAELKVHKVDLDLASRRESLKERAIGLRAVANDLAQSARKLADRTDLLSQRTEMFVEEHASEQKKSSKTVVRLRKNKEPQPKGDCNVDICSEICIADCAVLCGNNVFVRPAECATSNYCQTRCNTGCKADACEFRFDFELMPTSSTM